MWIVLILAAGAVLAGVAGLGFIYSGIYPIAASRPHTLVSRWLLTTTMTRSVQRYAAGVKAPGLNDARLVRHGMELYRRECRVCHGAPGLAADQIGRGINPDPPRLERVGSKWTDGEIYWIIRNGLKMSGMPAMGAAHTPTDLWSLVAFIRRMKWLSPQEYAQMDRAVSGDTVASDSVAWLVRGDLGFGALRARGNAERGRRWIGQYGCGACHVIPGIAIGTGKAGPPLDDFGERHYLAGQLVNTPDNLVAWLVNPQAIDPRNVMPRVGLTAAQALDVAAYLYALPR